MPKIIFSQKYKTNVKNTVSKLLIRSIGMPPIDTFDKDGIQIPLVNSKEFILNNKITIIVQSTILLSCSYLPSCSLFPVNVRPKLPQWLNVKNKHATRTHACLTFQQLWKKKQPFSNKKFPTKRTSVTSFNYSEKFILLYFTLSPQSYNVCFVKQLYDSSRVGFFGTKNAHIRQTSRSVEYYVVDIKPHWSAQSSDFTWTIRIAG